MSGRPVPPGATEALLAVADMAEHWWAMHRPIGWTRLEHEANPAINCCTLAENALARAVAEWVKIQYGPGGCKAEKVDA